MEFDECAEPTLFQQQQQTHDSCLGFLLLLVQFKDSPRWRREHCVIDAQLFTDKHIFAERISCRFTEWISPPSGRIGTCIHLRRDRMRQPLVQKQNAQNTVRWKEGRLEQKSNLFLETELKMQLQGIFCVCVSFCFRICMYKTLPTQYVFRRRMGCQTG